MAYGPVAERFIVHGRAELEAAFLQLRQEVVVGLRPAIIEAAQPMAVDTQRKTRDDLRNIEGVNVDWSEYRIGVTKDSVYEAPLHHRGRKTVSTPGQKRRRRGGHWGTPRPRTGVDLFREMQAALVRNEDELVDAIEAVIERSIVTAGLR